MNCSICETTVSARGLPNPDGAGRLCQYHYWVATRDGSDR